MKIKESVAYLVLGLSLSIDSSASCSDFLGRHNVQFSGALAGPGEIIIQEQKDVAHGILLNAKVFGAGTKNEQDTIVSVQGIGSCENGIVKVKLGADGTQNTDYLLLGGDTQAVFSKSLNPNGFGHWRMLILDKRTNERRRVDGFWMVSDTEKST